MLKILIPVLIVIATFYSYKWLKGKSEIEHEKFMAKFRNEKIWRFSYHYNGQEYGANFHPELFGDRDYWSGKERACAKLDSVVKRGYDFINDGRIIKIGDIKNIKIKEVK